MTKENLPEFLKIITTLSAVYDKNVSEELYDIYFESLKDFDIDEVKNAAGICVKTSKFFPKPAEIIALIKPVEGLDDKANKAWNLLLKAISRYGYYDSVQFEDVVIHSCIRAMGGWMQVSDRQPDTWMHKDFVDFYKSYFYNSTHPDKIAGMIEKQNGRVNLAFIPNNTEPKIIQHLQPTNTIRPIKQEGQLHLFP